MSQKFCNILVLCKAQFSRSKCFCQGCEGDELHWTVRFWARLILSKWCSPDFPLWLGAWFQTYLTLSDHQGSCNLCKISWTICLLYWDQLHLHLLHNKCFFVDSAVLWPSSNLQYVSSQFRLLCTFTNPNPSIYTFVLKTLNNWINSRSLKY